MAAGRTALVAAGFFAVALVVYAPALQGGFVGDDYLLSSAGPLHALGGEALASIWSPRSEVSVAYMNYSPVTATLHAAEIAAFGDRVLGFHVVNVALHAGASALLAALFVQAGLPLAVGLFGAGVFLLHPANVEAVAWMSQLKTTLCCVLAFAALLAQPRRPALATALFALALLAKPHAAFALPVFAVREWLRPASGEGAPRWGWVVGWAVLFVAFAAIASGAAGRGLTTNPAFADDRFLQLRAVLAVFARYVWMAVTTRGLSAYHQLELTPALGDPVWLAGLALVAAIAGRLAFALVHRRPDAVGWTWALAGFAPISQIFPFLYPFADRYLYFLLPGLLWGGLHLGMGLAERFEGSAARRALAAMAVVLSLALGARAAERAAVWQSQESVFADVAANYPDGLHGHLARARAAADRGDATATIAALRDAAAKGWDSVGMLYRGPDFEGVRDDPEFRRFADRVSGRALRGIYAAPEPSQFALSLAAQLHLLRGERDRARRALERAVAAGGPETAKLRAQLRALSAR